MAGMGMEMGMGGYHRGAAHAAARGLGWLSIGLGAAMLAAPRALCRLAGVGHVPMAPMIARGVGGRELGHAVSLLGSRKATRWVWARVAGDAMDLAMLGMALAKSDRRGRRRVMTTTAAIGAITVADLVTAIAGSRAMGGMHRALRLHAAVTVNRPSDQAYRFWHDFENLPRFMHHLQAVQRTGDGSRRSHWMAKGPGGRGVTWDAEIVEDKPNQLIAWRSTPDSRVPNSGRVLFLPAVGGRGTEVRVEIEYEPPVGSVGKAVAKLFGEDPEQQVRDDLRRFKQVIETGEVVRSEGSPGGSSVRQQLMQRPAQPTPAMGR